MEQDPQDTVPSCEQNNKEDGEEKCAWYINSPEHGNCLWRYIQAHSGPDGSMPELVQSQIAALLGWSNTKTHFALKQANIELVDALKKYKANQLLGSDHETTIETQIYDLNPIKHGSDDDES